MWATILWFYVVVSVSLCLSIKSTKTTSDGRHRMYLVFSRSEEDSLKIIGLKHEDGIDFWDTFHRNDQTARIMVASEKHRDFLEYLTSANIKFEKIIDDVESMIEAQTLENDLARARHSVRHSYNRRINSIDNHFWNLDEINSFLRKVAAKYPKFTKLFSVGKTYENRDIWGLQVSVAGAGEITNKRPIIIVDATIHAREWIAPMLAVDLIYQLTVNKNVNADLVDNLDWIIIPVINVDGFAYTFAKNNLFNRLWRKNRSPNKGAPNKPKCLGTDLNRNFDFNWGRVLIDSVRTSVNPCAEDFRGSSPASENETQGMQNILTKFKTVRLYLTVHSCGNYLMYPFGQKKKGGRIKNWRDHEKFGRKALRSIFSVNGTKYKLGNSAELLYTTTGTSDDYSAGKKKTVLSYVIELPCATNGSVFILEKERIKSVLTETFPGIKTLAEIVKKEYPVTPKTLTPEM